MAYYERPDYDVILKEKPYEIRAYAPFYMVTYLADKSGGQMEEGFQTLFRYISNRNEKRQKISMTVPVIEENASDYETMSFVVPKAFGDEVPLPLDERLSVNQMGEALYAVLRYRGSSNDKMEHEKQMLLEKWLSQKGYRVAGAFLVAYYNPPFIPGILRRNEVWVKVELI